MYILAGQTSEVAGGSDSEGEEEEEGIRYKEREEGIPWGMGDGGCWGYGQ